MDSKLLRISVISVLIITVLILVIVIWNNQETENTAVSADITEESAEEYDYRSFLNDDHFFDQEEEWYEALLENSGKTVNLSVTSVEHDLRILFLDVTGNIIEGAEFGVTLSNDSGQSVLYQDEDQDGILYITGLTGGEYEIQIENSQGYEFEISTETVQVSDALEYTEISDIGYFIIDSGEYDISPEYKFDSLDTSEESEEDDGGIRAVENNDGIGKLGVIINQDDEVVDWTELKEAGVQFAIMECGYRGGLTGAIIEESNFQENIEQALLEGIPVGVSFISQAVTEMEAVEEASAVLSMCKGYYLAYPVFAVSTSSGGNGRADSMTVEERSRVLGAFCKVIENAGEKAGICAGRSWIEQQIDWDSLKEYELWLTEYTDKSDYENYFVLWQFTGQGTLGSLEEKWKLCYSYMD